MQLNLEIRGTKIF